MNPQSIKTFTGPYGYLGNFYRCKVAYEGLIYPSSEHAFQAAKTRNKKARIAISECFTPQSAKEAGRALPLRPDWESVKIDVMRAVLRAKFSQNAVIRFALLDTGNCHLEEGNHHGDTFWGTVKGVGDNWLGKLLMELRTELRQEAAQ
jgi:ribA/ribD-fused uncharacterized protein